MSFGSNISSLRAIRRLAENSTSLSQTFERLSSGFRINKASDDAAGLAVHTSLNVDRRVYSQGVRNLNDGLSALNIADSTLNNASTIVTRLRELAAQASSGTFGLQQRKSLDAEAQALADEFFRITQSASFNGLGLFDGSLQGLRLQGGYGTDGSIFSRLGGAKWNGTLNAAASVGANSGGSRVVSGDLNGDGLADLVNLTTTGIAVRFGNGDGTFATETTYSMGSTTQSSVALGDFNGDGVLDVAAGGTSGGSGLLGIRINNGDGTFGTVTTRFTSGTSISSITVADINQDGKEDLLLGFASGVMTKSAYLLGNGNGTFAAEQGMQFGGIAGVTDIQVGDVNGDGLLDLLFSNTANQKLVLGTSDYRYENQSATDLSIGANTAKLVDMNGDGILDIVSASGSNIVVALGNGNGTFGANSNYSAGINVNRIKIGDFDGDGVNDVAASTTVGSASILLGNSNGSLRSSSGFSFSGVTATADIEIGDFNNDGVLDFAMSQSGQSTNVRTSATKDGINPILNFSLQTMADAKQALSQFKFLGDRISMQRGVIGAFQSRLNVASSLLSNSSEQFAAAESRIRDVDVASESAELVRKSIMQSAAASVLAQANQQPALALTLLKRDEA